MKRLYRNTQEKKIAGICSGLGDYFDIDPVIIRLIFLFALLCGGTGILIYIIAWFIVPKQLELHSRNL
jgi:phage shock protein C